MALSDVQSSFQDACVPLCISSTALARSGNSKTRTTVALQWQVREHGSIPERKRCKNNDIFEKNQSFHWGTRNGVCSVSTLTELSVESFTLSLPCQRDDAVYLPSTLMAFAQCTHWQPASLIYLGAGNRVAKKTAEEDGTAVMRECMAPKCRKCINISFLAIITKWLFLNITTAKIHVDVYKGLCRLRTTQAVQNIYFTHATWKSVPRLKQNSVGLEQHKMVWAGTTIWVLVT